jgi:hypothetical protein
MSNSSAPVFVRRSTVADIADLARLSALTGAAEAPDGVYLLAEVGGSTVAAVSLDRSEPVLRDPSHEDANVAELLGKWGCKLRREARRIQRHAA